MEWLHFGWFLLVQGQVDRKKEHHWERSQSVLEQNVAFEQHHHTSYPKNISKCEVLSIPQLHSIHNFLLINVIIANCRMSNPWHISGSNSVLWLHIWPCQSCTYEWFRVQVHRQDWGQSTVSNIESKTCPTYQDLLISISQTSKPSKTLEVQVSQKK